MPLIKQKLRWAEQVWWEPSVLKHNKLKIKIVENKTSIYKNYLYLFQPHLFVPLLVKLAVLCRLACNFIATNIQNVEISKDIDQKN